MTSTRSLAIVVCALVYLFAPAGATAQTEPAQLGALRTPPSPAFALLGLEPSAIERPATPADAALTLVNRLRDGVVPRNFAFETSPYWLVGRPNLTWQGDISRKIHESLARTTSISVGTAETGTDAAPVSSLALGVRTFLVSGRMNQATQQALTDLERTLQASGDVFLALMRKEGLTQLGVERANRTITPEAYDAAVLRLAETVRKSDAYLKTLADVKDVAAKREGFFLEIAAGLLWNFPNANWEAKEFRKRALWLTPSYEQGHWSFLGVLRYIDDSVTPNEDAVDWGGRSIYSNANYAVSLEFVERSPIDPTDTFKRSHRLVGIAEYRLASGMWAIASFGKDRQKTPTRDNTLVAQLGLSFNFSKDRYKF